VNERQQRFVEEYIIDLSATDAAKRAGYSPKQAGFIGYQLLQKTPIQDAIQAAIRARSARTGITADRVVLEIAKVAFADPRRVMSWGPFGVTLIDSSTLTDDDAAMIAEVSETRTKDGGSIRLKLNSKLDALEKLARHTGIYGADNKQRESEKRGYIILPGKDRIRADDETEGVSSGT
jgi:phage terminase small subunit